MLEQDLFLNFPIKEKLEKKKTTESQEPNAII